MRAHLVQTDIVWEDPQANFARVDALLASAGPAPGDLVVLPEMFDTGFSLNLAVTADQTGRTLSYLQSVAARLRVTVHGARTILGPDGRGRNCATAIAPTGQLLCEFHKMHPFTLGKEIDFFTGGDRVETYPWLDVAGQTIATIAPAVCYDLRFPELFRHALVAGAEIFCVGSSWPTSREGHRRALSIARAIENQAFMLSVNRCGRDPALEYAGGTLAISPRGEILGELGASEGVLSVEIDMADLHRWRRTFPAWKDHKLIGQGLT